MVSHAKAIVLFFEYVFILIFWESQVKCGSVHFVSMLVWLLVLGDLKLPLVL